MTKRYLDFFVKILINSLTRTECLDRSFKHYFTCLYFDGVVSAGFGMKCSDLSFPDVTFAHFFSNSNNSFIEL